MRELLERLEEASYLRVMMGADETSEKFMRGQRVFVANNVLPALSRFAKSKGMKRVKNHRPSDEERLVVYEGDHVMVEVSVAELPPSERRWEMVHPGAPLFYVLVSAWGRPKMDGLGEDTADAVQKALKPGLAKFGVGLGRSNLGGGGVLLTGRLQDTAHREKIQKEFGLPDEEERTAKRAAAIRKRTNRRGARPGGKR